MSQVKLIKIKLKENGKQIWLDWSDELMRRKEEVLATLKNEKVLSESCFLSEDEEYVYYFMEAEDFDLAKEAVKNNPHPIDLDHQKAKQGSFAEGKPLKCLFHFENR
ncbi:MAG: hypothetical protein QG580_332 [Patescibacteria group bacterium]|jgi:L-rhamnose mutarotase|nr:hypothetical protein [Patescibacteria group bacterium]